MKTIKKLLFVIIMAVATFGVADAQFRFGIKGGLNINNLDLTNPKDILENDNQTGYTIGVMTEFTVPVIGLCFDLSAMYTRMNAEVGNIIDSDEVENKINNKNFIEIPLNIKYRLSLPAIGKIISPMIFTGPSFAFKLDKNTIDYWKTKTCQVAWNVGIGVELFRHLQLQGSYGFGINNIAEHWVNDENLKVKNNYWTVTLAYLF